MGKAGLSNQQPWRISISEIARARGTAGTLPATLGYYDSYFRDKSTKKLSPKYRITRMMGQ
jgi:hypothetical protein